MLDKEICWRLDWLHILLYIKTYLENWFVSRFFINLISIATAFLFTLWITTI